MNHVMQQKVCFDTPDIQRPAYVIMMVADGLVPNEHQAICNHHAD